MSSRPGRIARSGLFFRLSGPLTRLVVNSVHRGFAADSFRISMNSGDFSGGWGGIEVLKILIVEDDSQLATTL